MFAVRKHFILGWSLISAGILPAGTETYSIATIAGGKLPSGPARSANLGLINSVTMDRDGNVYLSLDSYSAVARMDPQGNITVVAGSGEIGFSGDGGPAISARLRNPQGLAVDRAGNLYIADSGSNRIRKVTNGIITTIAGSDDASEPRDGPAINAGIYIPWDLALDAADNLYIAEFGHPRIRKISSGIISTVAGDGTVGYGGDGGLAVLAKISNPTGVAVSASGDVFIADQYNGRIRKVSNGLITTVVGPGFNGWPKVALDGSGSLYAVGTWQIRKFDPSGCCSVVIAGASSFGEATGDSGPANQAGLARISGAVFNAAGDLYVADSGAGSIRKITNGIINTVAGGGSGGDNGPATEASISPPAGIAAGPDGAIYFAEPYAHRVRKLFNGIITTIAGNGIPGFSGDSGPAASAQLNTPSDVASDANGAIYIADTGNYRVRKIAGGIITTVAGNGYWGYNGDNLPALMATLASPYSVAVDTTGILYVGEIYYRVRKVINGIVTTIAGNGTAGQTGDYGPAVNAQLYPNSLAVAPSGDLYVGGSSTVRKISNGIITAVAGNGTYGFSGDGGPATSALLGNTSGIGVDSLGNLYIADTYISDARIRKVINGTITTIAGAGTIPFVANLSLKVGVDSNGNVYVSDAGHRTVDMLSCVISIGTPSARATKFGGSFNVNILGPAGCAWKVSALPDWVTVSGPSSGIAPGVVTLNAAPNPDAPRIGQVSISAATLNLTQTDAGCTYAISSSGQAYTPAAATGSIDVTAEIGCAWTTTGVPSWVTPLTGAGTGNGTATYQVTANSGEARLAQFTIAGQSFMIEQ